MIPLKDDIPCNTIPYVTMVILALNVAVFVYELTLGPNHLKAFVYSTAAVPADVLNFAGAPRATLLPRPFTLLTAMFVHGSVLHIAGNMLFLWIFADNIEDVFGHFYFAVFYMVTGLAAGFTHVLINSASTVPMIGASGAIAGVLGAYFLLFPRAKVLTLVFLLFFVTIIRIPAVVFLGLWFLLQVMSSGAGGGIAWYAHIGGFLAGALAVFVFRPGALKRTRA